MSTPDRDVVPEGYALVRLPAEGEVWHWEPLVSHASCRLVVQKVEWNGYEWWITAQPTRGIANMPDDRLPAIATPLGRWMEACVLVTPSPGDE